MISFSFKYIKGHGKVFSNNLCPSILLKDKYACLTSQEILRRNWEINFYQAIDFPTWRNSVVFKLLINNADLVQNDEKVYMINVCLSSNLTHLCPQCEEERFCKHDTAGGPHIVQKHHLLYHTSCLCRSGKPQSSTPQQVWIITALENGSIICDINIFAWNPLDKYEVLWSVSLVFLCVLSVVTAWRG